MSLIQYVKPFLDLGICKEYSMARKTTANGVTTRSRRTETPLQPVEMQGAPEVSSEISNEVPREVRNGKLAAPVPINQSAMNQSSINQNSIHQNSVNQKSANPGSSADVEEEIRNRAYELYQQRRANGGDAGDPRQDWLTAEREILSRQNGRERKSA